MSWEFGPPPRTSAPVVTTVVEGFFSRLSFGLLSFTLPLFAYHLGLPLPLIGVLLSVNMAVAMLVKPAMGAVVDAIGVRPAMLAACVLRTVVLVALVFTTAPEGLFWARALHGVSIALRDPASASVLAAVGGKQAVARRFGWYQSAKTLAGSLGQFSAGVLLSLTLGDHRVVLAIAAALSLIPLGVVAIGLRGSEIAALHVPSRDRAEPALSPQLRSSLWRYSFLGFSMTGTAYLMANLLPVFAVEGLGMSPAAAGSLYLVTAVISLSGPMWGWIADRYSVRLVLGFRAFGNICSSLVWLIFPNHPGLLVGKAFDDIGKAAFRPAWGAVMAEVSALDPARRARSLAWMTSAEDAGEMAGPVIAGLIWSLFGLPAVLITRIVCGIGTEIYAARLTRRRNTS